MANKVEILVEARTGKAKASIGGLADTVKKHNKAIGVAMTAVGAGIVAVGVSSVKAYAKMGDEVQKMAARTGFSTEALSELRHAAELSGTSLGSIEKGAKKLSKAIVDADDGLATYQRAFDKLGLSTKNLLSMNPEEQFFEVAQAMAAEENQAVKTALAVDLFGRAGTALLPMLASGEMGLESLREEAHKLGIVFDQEAANKAALFNDSMSRLNRSLDGVKFKIAEAVLPILIDLIKGMEGTVRGVVAWTKENPRLTRIIIAASAAIGSLLLVLGPLLILLPSIASGIAMMGGAMKLLTMGGVIGLAVTAITLLAAAWGKNWGNIRGITQTVINSMAQGISWFVDKAIQGFQLFFKVATAQFRALAKVLAIVGDRLGIDAFKGLDEAIGYIDEEMENLRGNIKRKMGGMQEAAQSWTDTFQATGVAVAGTSSRMVEGLAEVVESVNAMENVFDTPAIARSMDEWAEGLDKLEEKALALSRAGDSTAEAWERFRKKQLFLLTEAGKLGLTFDDVAQAALQTSHTMHELEKVIEEFAVKQGDVNALLEATGLVASEVTRILDGTSEAYEKLGETAEATARRLEATWVAIARHTGQTVDLTGKEGQQFISATKGKDLAEQLTALQDPALTWVTPYAKGGIVTKPSLILAGESGPEAIIPLNKGKGVGDGITVIFQGPVFGLQDFDQRVVTAVRDAKLNGGFYGVD